VSHSQEEVAILEDMSRKKKLTEEQEKDIDHFADRLAAILLKQVEEEAIAKKNSDSQELTSIDKER
jgi:hypothetical protein